MKNSGLTMNRNSGEDISMSDYLMKKAFPAAPGERQLTGEDALTVGTLIGVQARHLQKKQQRLEKEAESDNQ